MTNHCDEGRYVWHDPPKKKPTGCASTTFIGGGSTHLLEMTINTFPERPKHKIENLRTSTLQRTSNRSPTASGNGQPSNVDLSTCKFVQSAPLIAYAAQNVHVPS